MAITYRTVTGNLADLLRTDFDPSTVRITVRTNLDSGDAPIDLTNGQILLGTGRVTVATDGTFSTTNVIDHASTDVNPTGIQYRWDIDYTPRNGQRVTSWTSGFINVGADADLSTLVATQYVPPSYQNAFIAEAEAIRDDIIDLSGIAVPDALVEALVKNTGGAGPLTSAALTATFAPIWKTGTAYTVGQVIQAPDGGIVKVTTAHTAGGSYDATKFSVADGPAAAFADKLDNAATSADGAVTLTKLTKVDASGANRAMTLPDGTVKGQQIAVEKSDASANTVTITGKIRSTGSSSISLVYQYETLLLIWGGTFWEPLAGHRTKASLDAGYIKRASGSGGGYYINADPTLTPRVSIGNKPDSGGWPGTGSPTATRGALAVYEEFGTNNGANTPIPKSTQSIFVVGSYFGPTSEDSAEAGSSSVLMKDTGTPYTQSQQVVAWEGTAHIETGVTASYLVSGTAGRVEVQGSANDVYSFKASANAEAGSTGSVTGKYVAFGQPATPPRGTFTSKYGVYVIDPINSETQLTVGNSSWTGTFSAKIGGNSDSAVSLLVVKGPDSLVGDPSPRGLTEISVVAGANQTRAMFEARDSGGSTRFQISAAGSVNMSGQQINVQTSGGTSQITLNPTSGLTLNNAVDVVIGSGTGTKLGQSTSKIGFWGATPVVRPTGWAKATGTATRTTFDTTTVTLPQLAEHVKALIDDMFSDKMGLIGA